jgi:hypothetical protein
MDEPHEFHVMEGPPKRRYPTINTIRCHNPGGLGLNLHRRGKPKSGFCDGDDEISGFTKGFLDQLHMNQMLHHFVN